MMPDPRDPAAGGARRRVLLVGAYVMPDGTPAALRALGIARSLALAGYPCEIGAAEIIEHGAWIPAGGTRTYFGIRTTALGEFGGPSSRRIDRVIGGMVGAGGPTRRWLEGWDPREIAAVISMGGYTPATIRLLSWQRRSRVPLVVDVVDWYDPRHCPGGPLGPYHLQVKFALRYLNKKTSGVIAISSWLEHYYREAGLPVIKVPPTLDTEDPIWHQPANRNGETTLVLGYAGTPGKKDDLEMVFQAVDRLRARGADIRLTVLGPSAGELAQRLAGAGLSRAGVPAWITCKGRVPHADVPRLLAETDFSVLMRPNERYANAGFPTKVVESLALGVPVITNRTSDLPSVIETGVDGFLVDDYSASALERALDAALAVPVADRARMRQQARAKARDRFDYRGFAAPLAEFVARLSSPAVPR